ncbi:hypothetical protein MPLB_2420043 [Mesorhizobium sp. ORS 3324]|nr:hypothetical protein MPLB_2420043 [Mesorhizobium sp. ORS 3324]
MTKVSSQSPARLFTAFGTVLYVDPSTGELRHGPTESSPSNLFFDPGKHSGSGERQGQLIHSDKGSPEPIVCHPDICLTGSRSQRENRASEPTMLELIPLERGLMALKSGDVFLSAIPDGKVTLCAEVCSTWELFLATESWCTDIVYKGARWYSETDKFDRQRIQSYIVHPTIRADTNASCRKRKVLIYGYTKWSHGRVYYDLSKRLHSDGYIIDIIDWQNDNSAHFRGIKDYYDFFLTALDGVSNLVDSYHVPYEKIIGISHHEFDMRMLIERKGIDVFDRLANYGVVSEYLYSASALRGIARLPKVVPLGVDYQYFFSALPTSLTTVGYATSMSLKTYGIELKRGELAEAAAREAGLAFKVAGSTANQVSFHDMPEFYRSVDAVVSTSINESGPLSVLEGAAAGRLVIGTPVGHFPIKAYQGGGIVAPIEPEKFKAFTSSTLRYYKENPAAFVDKCHETREAAVKFDWQYMIDDWKELIDRPGSNSKLTPSTAPLSS